MPWRPRLLRLPPGAGNNRLTGVSVSGHFQTWAREVARSALPSRPDIASRACQVRKVPEAEVRILLRLPSLALRCSFELRRQGLCDVRETRSAALSFWSRESKSGICVTIRITDHAENVDRLAVLL